MKPGLYTKHWLFAQSGKRKTWYHKSDQQMQVEIRPQTKFHALDHARAGKYRISHTHPTKAGHVIMQPYEYASTMVEARRLAVAHLKNWNNPLRWFKHH